ncbi:acyl-homoserine-lactone synthase [Microvirga terrestris]|uniref:Acyl-homoserine-lactone synthase n=1 Tax=Microvirga terrestris TaxID=2791024 RepID=A0ABS0HUG5_9HYPH|nr:acyl-homoserine-lactone synthase [Microvirga terrestris]MBF9197123.1 GNAT family N-acetyltransferase [Microvirga terrestris]
MTSIHVITDENRAGYQTVLDAYFRLRHEIFVGERGWRALERPDGRDVDAYDNDQATYLVALDNGRVIGGLRLYPTLLPHMISESFAHLVKGRDVLSGSTILECTRYFIVRERRMGRTDCRLLAAFQQFCLEEGVTEVTAVVEMWWLPRWQQAGFKVRPLGLPTLVEGQPCIAAAIQISEDSLRHVSRLAGLRGSCLVRAAEAPTVVNGVPHVAA